MMGAVDELGSRGLTHWSRAVINGLCFCKYATVACAISSDGYPPDPEA
jgi:hypothetical protein